MEFQFGVTILAMAYLALIFGILGTALYALILLIKALKIYIRKNS